MINIMSLITDKAGGLNRFYSNMAGFLVSVYKRKTLAKTHTVVAAEKTNE